MCRCAAAPNAVKLLFGTRNVDAKEKATAAKAKRTLNTGATAGCVQAKDTLTKALEPFQQQFQRSGVSLVTDGYKDINGHHISNYLLVCALGAYFHSSVNSTVGPDTTVRVDASDSFFKTAKLMLPGLENQLLVPIVTYYAKNESLVDAIYTAQRMHRVVQAVGVHMFVAIVTDSAAVMPAAVRALHDMYPQTRHISWVPCTAHWCSLVIKDIAVLIWVGPILGRAMNVIKAILGYGALLSIFSSHSCMVGDTRMATKFLAAERLLLVKDALDKTVVDDRWKAYARAKPHQLQVPGVQLRSCWDVNREDMAWCMHALQGTCFGRPTAKATLTSSLWQPGYSRSQHPHQLQSKYGFILSKRRNRLTTSRASMLVFNFSNSRLLRRTQQLDADRHPVP
ncbi:hypothetical protein QJQ45_029672 [Haematococcus lacustris]|nr:hypothetical protein QJQ45_029672 [Haematococcus lacustris]